MPSSGRAKRSDGETSLSVVGRVFHCLSLHCSIMLEHLITSKNPWPYLAVMCLPGGRHRPIHHTCHEGKDQCSWGDMKQKGKVRKQAPASEALKHAELQVTRKASCRLTASLSLKHARNCPGKGVPQGTKKNSCIISNVSNQVGYQFLLEGVLTMKKNMHLILHSSTRALVT